MVRRTLLQSITTSIHFEVCRDAERDRLIGDEYALGYRAWNQSGRQVLVLLRGAYQG